MEKQGQRAGRLGTTSDEWAEEVRDIMLGRFDRDVSGSRDQVVEIRAVPCDVWQAMAATHPDYPYGLGFLAGDVYVGEIRLVPLGVLEVVVRRLVVVHEKKRLVAIPATL